MQIYTAQFLKIVIKILQRGHKFLNMENMKGIIDSLVKSDKLLVVVNTLPLYIMSQMFFAGECVMEDEYREVTLTVFDLIESHITALKQSTAQV